MDSRILQYITRFAPPSEVIETRNGPVRYERWLEMEMARMKRTDWPLSIERSRNGEQIALAILRIQRPERDAVPATE
jgi:hypothetical protein